VCIDLLEAVLAQLTIQIGRKVLDGEGAGRGRVVTQMRLHVTLAQPLSSSHGDLCDVVRLHAEDSGCVSQGLVLDLDQPEH
jgi:hypothetical protein